MQWVEKVILEKIRKRLEVFEQECHCEVLLMLKNLADVRQSSTAYSLLIMTDPLPSDRKSAGNSTVTSHQALSTEKLP